MTTAMHPVLFEINGFAIHTYGFMGAIGFLVVAGVALWRTRAMGLQPERTADLIFWSAVTGLIGSRIVFIAQNPDVFGSWTQWFNLRTGGLVFYGAILFAVPAASFLLWRFKFPFFATWDVFASVFPIGHGFARLGCFGAGCCYGSACDQPWAVVFTDPMSAARPLNTPLHPTQLYEASFLFLLGAFLQVLYYKKSWNGQVMLTYLVFYAIGRSVIETYRGDASRGFFLPQILGEALTYSQGISVVLALFAIVVFGVIARRVHTPA